jgi:rhodanese-related sulfurtransferase
MAQLIEFIGNHLALVAAFIGVLGALLYTLVQGGGAAALSPQRAVLVLNQDDAVPVDVRPDGAYKAGHIINAVNVSQQDITGGAARLAKYKDRPLLVYCESGLQSGAAVKALRRQGYTKVYNLRGGLAAWRGENLPVQGAR